jgi:hypothetical protein
MGLKHQEASEAAHPVDVREAFQLGFTSYQISATSDPEPWECVARILCLPNTYQSAGRQGKPGVGLVCNEEIAGMPVCRQARK